MSDEIKEFEFVLHFLIDGKDKKDALKEFVKIFGLSILDNCDEYEVIES